MVQACLVPSEGWARAGGKVGGSRSDAVQHEATRAMKTKAETFHLHSTTSLRLALNNGVHQQKRNENWKIPSLCGRAGQKKWLGKENVLHTQRGAEGGESEMPITVGKSLRARVQQSQGKRQMGIGGGGNIIDSLFVYSITFAAQLAELDR